MKRLTELVLYASPALVALLSAPILARALGVEGRGYYAVALAVASLSTTLGALGQAELHAADFREGAVDRRTRAITAVIGGAAASAIGFLVMVIFLDVPRDAALAAVALLPISVTLGLWRAEHIARAQLLTPSVVNAGSSVLRLGVLAGLSVTSALSLAAALWTTQAAAAIGALILWLSALRLQRLQSPIDTPRISRRSQFRTTSQVLLFAALTAVLLRSDVLVLQITSSPAQVGIYAAAVGLSEAFLAISAGFKARLQAVVYAEQAGRRILKELAVLHGLLIPMLVVVAVAADFIVTSLFGADFAPAAGVLRVLMIAAYFQVLMDCGTGVLVVLGKRSQLVLASLVGAIVAIGSLLPLTLTLGAYGAAWSSAIAYASVAGIAWWSVLGPSSRSRGSTLAG